MALVDASENTHNSVCTASIDEVVVYVRGTGSCSRSRRESLQASHLLSLSSGRNVSQSDCSEVSFSEKGSSLDCDRFQ